MKKFKMLSTALAAGLALSFCAFGVGCTRERGEEVDPTKTQIFINYYNGGLGAEWITALKEAYEEEHPEIQIMPIPGKTTMDSGTVLNNFDTYDGDLFFMDYVGSADLNSFRNVQRAIEFEIARQSDVLDDGEKVVQETRLYDANRNITAPMRSKEDAQDYRYFPDPDLLPVVITDEELAEWAATQPELPEARMARYMGDFQLPEQDAEQLCTDPHLAALFEKAAVLSSQPKKVANIMLGMMMREINQTGISTADIRMSAEAVSELVTLIGNGTISAKIAADIFPELMNGDIMPAALVKERGLVQVSDTGAIDAAVQKVLAANPAEVEAYRGGKTKLISFFVGQVMREMRGKANPALVNEALSRFLGQA